jgi:hypothetical protein
MGNSASGRWHDYQKACTVEQCLALDANRLTSLGLLGASVSLSGQITWGVGEAAKKIDCEVCTRDEAAPWLRLRYAATATGAREDYRLRLTTTSPWFGGRRWWFVCPLVAHGEPCNRRVGKLYLPPGARSFGCRRCHRLTYASCQEHDKRVDALLRDPALLVAAIYGPRNVVRLFLAARALAKEERQRRKRERRHANLRPA